MTAEILTSLIMFAFVASITPGPNNLMLMASTANFGFWPTLPHLLGILCGFVFLILVVGLGLAEVFEIWPILHTALMVVGLVYMLYLAWRIATAAEPGRLKVGARPMTFLQAVAFQWVNPKAWAMALTATTVFAVPGDKIMMVMVALIFGAINLPCISSWAVLGLQLRRLLTNSLRLRAFNWTMMILLLLSILLTFRY